MAILLRLLTVAVITVVCITVFAALFELLNAAATYIIPPDGVNDVDVYRHSMPILGALWWGVMFRAPGYIFFGTVPLVIVLAVAEWRSMKKWSGYFAIWSLAALLATGPSLLMPFGLGATLLAAALSSYLYWHLNGKSAGDRLIDRWMGACNGRFKLLNYAAYAVFAYLAFLLSGYVYHGAKLVWVTYLSQPDLGTPPFQVISKRGLTASQKVAMMDFPDPASCLKVAEVDGSPLDHLKEMDWDQIDNADEADVCMFRLLASYEDLSSATDWFEAQGFKVPHDFSSAHPYVERDGRKRVYAGYSISKNGPKFPTKGIVRRALGSIPYSMRVNATWSEDGKRLLGVETGFDTL